MALKACLLPVLLWGSATAASAMQPAGLIEVRPDGTRTIYTTERLNRNDRVLAQHGDAEAQGAGAKCCVSLRILGVRKPRAGISDELNGRPVKAYALPSLKATEITPFIGGALVFKAGERMPAGTGRALLDRAAGNGFPQACTSSEGMHLLQLNEGKPQTHLYMHFGYAVEPTCSTALLERFY
ncbi:hypothetical protein ACIPRI_24080 [Variovorax sp. LARHSF232]